MPDHGGIPYTLSVKLTVSTNLSVCSAKENFLWMKSSETYASFCIIMDIESIQALPCTELAIGSLRSYLGTLETQKQIIQKFCVLKPIALETVLL